MRHDRARLEHRREAALGEREAEIDVLEVAAAVHEIETADRVERRTANRETRRRDVVDDAAEAEVEAVGRLVEPVTGRAVRA